MEEPKEQPAAAQAMGDEETQARIIAVLAGASSLTISCLEAAWLGKENAAAKASKVSQRRRAG